MYQFNYLGEYVVREVVAKTLFVDYSVACQELEFLIRKKEMLFHGFRCLFKLIRCNSVIPIILSTKQQFGAKLQLASRF